MSGRLAVLLNGCGNWGRNLLTTVAAFVDFLESPEQRVAGFLVPLTGKPRDQARAPVDQFLVARGDPDHTVSNDPVHAAHGGG